MTAPVRFIVPAFGDLVHDSDISYPSAASPLAMANYGRALLVIAGADGEVSQAKFDWLERHQRKFGAPDEVISQYRDFDFRNADLAALLNDISVNVQTWSAGRT